MLKRVAPIIVAAFAVVGCSSPSAPSLAEAIRTQGGDLVSDVAIRQGDLSEDWLQVTFRPGVGADQMHALWCRVVAPNGGAGMYDAGTDGIRVETDDSSGQEVVVPIRCP